MPFAFAPFNCKCIWGEESLFHCCKIVHLRGQPLLRSLALALSVMSNVSITLHALLSPSLAVLSLSPAVLLRRSRLPETPRFSQDVERDEAKALKNTIAVKSNEGDFIEDYSAGHKMDRISGKSLNRYMTFPSILRNR